MYHNTEILQLDQVSSLEKFTCSPFRQEIELQQVEHAAGYRSLRLRIREGKRFTVFDIDAQTAERWGQLLSEWATKQGEPK
jgi:predicted nucleic acid-binding protein